MKIILLATWPNGQTQHIYSTSSRLIAKSQHNAKLNRHVIEVTGPDAKFLAECIWHPKAMSPAVPMVVDEHYNPIHLGSELGPVNIVMPEDVPQVKKRDGLDSFLDFIRERPIFHSDPANATNEPNQKETLPPVEEIRQELPESRELPVVPEQQAAPASETVAEVDDDLTVNEDADPEADMPLEEVICKRVSEFGRLKVNTLAANLGVTAPAIKVAVKNSSLLKITGTKNNTSVSAK